MAIFGVFVAKGSKQNFLDGIANDIWGFTELNKINAEEDIAPSIGDIVVFAYGLTQDKSAGKGSFPRIKSTDDFLDKYKPTAEMLSITRLEAISFESIHQKVFSRDGEEIWRHKDSTGAKHKFPYRIKIKTLQTFYKFNFKEEGISRGLADALRLSAAHVGALRVARNTTSVFIDGSDVAQRSSSKGTSNSNATSKEIELEANNTSTYNRKSVVATEASRKESALVRDYSEYLSNTLPKLPLGRTQITLPNGTNLFTDLTVKKSIVEAKSNCSRQSIRMAIGQLFDYENLIGEKRQKTILLPDRPDDSLCSLLKKLGFHLVYRDNDTFTEVAPK